MLQAKERSDELCERSISRTEMGKKKPKSNNTGLFLRAGLKENLDQTR